MNQESRYILINNLIGLSLGFIAITSFTAGLPYEILILSSMIAHPFLTFQIIKQPTWLWRLIFIGLLIIQINSFNNPILAESFNASNHGYFLTVNQIANLKLLTPYAAGFCLTSFWTVFISTIKKNKKTLPGNN